MASQDEIHHQQSLLTTYRRTLAVYRQQQAKMGVRTPPDVILGIEEARKEIHRIKATLRQWGAIVEDYPDDSDSSQATLATLPGKADSPTTAVQQDTTLSSSHRA